MFASVKSLSLLTALCVAVTQVKAHYTFPSLVVNGKTTAAWANVRQTNNYNSRSPVTDVKSADFRCYTSQTGATATTIDVAAGSQLGIVSDGTIYHPGPVNVYMAKAPSTAAGWSGDGAVWFKVHEVGAVTDGGSSINWPAYNAPSVTFTLPKSLPSGQYLVRIESIALHSASTFGGAQFYISCGQINVTGGGSGKPGPLVSIPGVYTGNEPGILINIYYPVPKTYTNPGPVSHQLHFLPFTPLKFRFNTGDLLFPAIALLTIDQIKFIPAMFRE
ncbi:putative endo-beta-1,4-glucanase D [Hypsizygus marmoreus]|uniref:lytic cellulose monooxygenase (C4-dehydrogenating) n=1 Tax=Hypsizygus marmoreus TaxID=39966 RepID=A0A369JW71_HYPMA|nr:putative endo-beta-1,4-glucanase D [Hypsizygus marmoreus]